MIRPLIFLLPFVAVMGAQAQPTRLRIQYLPGERYVLTQQDSATQRVQLEMPAMLGGATHDQNTRSVRLTVADIAVAVESDSSVVLMMTYRRMRQWTSADGVFETVDTDSVASLAASPMGAILKAMLNFPMRVRMTDTGHATMLTDPEGFISQVIDATPLPPESREGMHAQLRGMLEGGMDQLTTVLPAGPVVPGQAWPHTLRLSGPIPLNVVLNNRYDGQEGDTASISFTGQLDLPGGFATVGEGPMASRMKMEGAKEGWWRLNLQDATYRMFTSFVIEAQSGAQEASAAMPSPTMRMINQSRSHASLLRQAP